MLKETKRPIISFDGLSENGIVLRFDVDYDVSWASELARINAQHDIYGTFFVLTNSPLYNLRSTDSLKALNEINACGQFIGLHYWHEGGKLDRKRVVDEFDILKSLLPQVKKIIAWHNPIGSLHGINRVVEKMGFVCAYADTHFSFEKYISDSNCQHGYDEISVFIQRSSIPLIQLLLHPFNWVVGGNNIEEVLVGTFLRKIDLIGEFFDDNRVWKSGLGEKIFKQLNLCDFYNTSMTSIVKND